MKSVAMLLLGILLQCILLNSAIASNKFSRDDLERDIVAVEELISRAEGQVTHARQLAKAEFARRAQESGVHALFTSDRAGEFQQRAKDKVERLSFSFKYERSIIKRQLLARHDQATRRRAALEEEAVELAAKAAEPHDRLVSLYLLQREVIRSRIAQGVGDEAALIGQLSALARIPVTLVAERMVTLDNLSRCRVEGDIIHLPDGKVLAVTTNQPAGASQAEEAALYLSQLQSSTERLRQEVEQLRQHAATNQPVVVTNVTVSPVLVSYPFTNLVLTATSQSITHTVNHPPPAITNINIVPSTTVNQLTHDPPPVELAESNSVPAFAAGQDNSVEDFGLATEQTPVAVVSGDDVSVDFTGVEETAQALGQTHAPTNVETIDTIPVPSIITRSADQRPVNFEKSLMLLLAVIAVAVLAGLSLKALLRWSHRRFEVVIVSLDPVGIPTSTALSLQPGTDRIVVGEGRLRSEPADLAQEIPAAILLDRLGRAFVVADSAPVFLNGKIIEHGKLRLRIGDQFQLSIGTEVANAQTYVLREITVAADDDAELAHAATAIN